MQETIITGEIDKKWTAKRVIVDPGSIHTLIDHDHSGRKRLPLKIYEGPDIEMANGMFEKPKGQTGPLLMEFAGVGASVRMKCVDANKSYDILLRIDLLKAATTTTNFENGEYVLGGQVRVSQVGRMVMGQVQDQEPEEELDEDLLANLSSLQDVLGERDEDNGSEEECVAKMSLPMEKVNVNSELDSELIVGVKNVLQEYPEVFAGSFEDKVKTHLC